MKNKNFLVITICGFFMLLAFGYVGYSYNKQNTQIKDRSETARQRLEEFEKLQTSTSKKIPDTLPFDSEAVIEQGETLVINRVPGLDYGKLAIRKPDGTREILNNTCMRSHAANGIGVCIDKTSLTGYTSTLLNLSSPDLLPLGNWGTLLPSRIRVSADASYATTTVFTSGSSYQDVAGFSTFVEFFDLENRDNVLELEDFSYTKSNSRFGDIAGDFWGVTFTPENDFYATFGIDDQIEIIKGSIEDKEIEPTGILGSCPSVSPDGKTMVYKKMVDNEFQLVAIDLETNVTTEIGEISNIDDQVEWLDNDTILYALHTNEIAEDVQPEFDIWSIDIAAGSEPKLFLPNADSPAVYRVIN